MRHKYVKGRRCLEKSTDRHLKTQLPGDDGYKETAEDSYRQKRGLFRRVRKGESYRCQDKPAHLAIPHIARDCHYQHQGKAGHVDIFTSKTREIDHTWRYGEQETGQPRT